MLESQRHLFQLPAGAHFLNCAYMAPLLRSVEAAGVAGIAAKRFPGPLPPAAFFEESDRVRSLFGRLIGAPAGRIALVPSVSYAIATVASNLELGPGDAMVVAGEQFPSNVYSWRRLSADAGAELRTVHRPVSGGADEGGTGSVVQRWNDALLRAIDHTTRLVALPHAHWTDGTLFDLVRIGARAREVGATFVVDGTQSVGAHPFHLAEIRPDVLVCAGYKWLLGPYSLGVAYFGERFDGARPLEETWIGRAGSEDFAALVDYRDQYRPDASRFDVGERSNFILVPMLARALEQILDWGVARVAGRCSRLTALVAAGASELGFEVGADDERSASIVGLRRPPGVDPTRLQAGLDRRGVYVSQRGSSLRVSPHVYNDEDDVDALLDGLREACRR